jgi:hypothetical protein
MGVRRAGVRTRSIGCVSPTISAWTHTMSAPTTSLHGELVGRSASDAVSGHTEGTVVQEIAGLLLPDRWVRSASTAGRLTSPTARSAGLTDGPGRSPAGGAYRPLGWWSGGVRELGRRVPFGRLDAPCRGSEHRGARDVPASGVAHVRVDHRACCRASTGYVERSCAGKPDLSLSSSQATSLASSEPLPCTASAEMGDPRGM